MDVHQINPVEDPRWRCFLSRHPDSSVFHSVEWLGVLRETYGYQPIAFTTSAPGTPIANGCPFCIVQSWITGQRLVSLPFSDHCQPLFDSVIELQSLIQFLKMCKQRDRWKYVEIRPIDEDNSLASKDPDFRGAKEYFLHRIDLQPSAEQLFRGLHKDSIQRRIRHAAKIGLKNECGRSETLLHDFYQLLVKTRSRHRVPPQPYLWFRNLLRGFGESVQIRAAYQGGTPVASILTLKYKNTVYYKYGCSDARLNHLGATPMLMWEAIAEAKEKGATTFDLGRTDCDNAGLIAFKNKWGSQSRLITYRRFPGPATSNEEEWKLSVLKKVFSYMPGPLLQLTGNVIYRHIG